MFHMNKKRPRNNRTNKWKYFDISNETPWYRFKCFKYRQFLFDELIFYIRLVRQPFAHWLVWKSRRKYWHPNTNHFNIMQMKLLIPNPHTHILIIIIIQSIEVCEKCEPQQQSSSSSISSSNSNKVEGIDRQKNLKSGLLFPIGMHAIREIIIQANCGK